MSQHKNIDWPRDGGELGELIRTFDWSKTSLGPKATWPQSLKTTVDILLRSPTPIVTLWGEDGIMIYNDAYSVFAGARHPRLLGSKVLEGWPEVADFNAHVMKVGLSGRTLVYRDQHLLLYRNGIPEDVWMNLDYSPVVDESGQPAGVLAIVAETTGRVIGERRLRTLREVSSRAAASGPVEAVCQAAMEAMAENLADLPQALLYLVNDDDKACLIASYRVEPPGDARQIDLQADDERSMLFAGVRTRGQVEESRGELLLAGPPLADQVLVLPITSGEIVVGFLVVGLDPFLSPQSDYRDFLNLVAAQISKAVATAKALEDERKRAEALAELDRAKTSFFSNVSHEFRTPLTLMLGPVEDSLADPEHPLPPVQRARQELVHRSAIRLLKLVNNLLDFSRIEAGRIQAVYEPTDLAIYTAELASVFRSTIEQAGLSLVVDVHSLPEPVYVDREMWEKVVLNLLSNAFKFTFEGEIEVRIRSIDGQVALSVRDTGTGIPEEELPHLFDRFHRVEGAQGRTNEGTGIGLALVLELVRLHGGKVQVESAVGQGSTFTVTIPTGTAHLPPDRLGTKRKEARAASGADSYVTEVLRWLPDGVKPANPNAAAAGEAGQPGEPVIDGAGRGDEHERKVAGRIVLADDNADMRGYVHSLLSPWYDVVTVPDGKAALLAIRDQVPDLVLADVMMPRLDGFELLRELRTDGKTKELPIILLSARAGEESRVEGLEAGADDYLVKPFSARELQARVRTILETARARREAARAVQESEARLHLALETAHLGAWQLDLVTGDFDATATCKANFGLPPEATVGVEAIRSMVHPQDRARVQQVIEQALEQGTAYEAEYRVIWPDGTLHWIISHGRGLRDDKGELRRIVGVTANVTERYVQERTQRFLIDLSQATQPLTDPDEIMSVTARMLGDFLGVNRCGYAEVEADEDHIVIVEDYARDTFGFVGRFSLSAFGSEVLRLMRENKPFVVHDAATDPRLTVDDRAAYRHNDIAAVISVPLRKSGRLVATMAVQQKSPRRWMTEEVALVRTVVGRCWESIERARVARSLRESEARFRATFEQVAVGMAHVAPDGSWLRANLRFSEIVGYSEEELSQLTFQHLTHPDDRDASRQLAVSLLDNDIQTASLEKRYIRKDGSLIWINLTTSLLRTDAGQPEYFISVYEDISDRKRTELLLREQNSLLELIASGYRLHECLSSLCAAVARLNSGVRAAVLLADDRRQSIEHPIAPDLLPSFAAGLEGVPINDLCNGTSGEADFLGKPVACEDIANDSTWSKEWRDLCLAHGVMASHSTPILDVDGRPLGSFMLCFDEPRAANEWELRLADFGTHIASIALERERAGAALEAARVEAETERRRLAQLIAQAPAAIAVLRGPHHVYEIANEHYQAFTGNRDVIGKPIREALPELAGQGIYELLDQVYRTGERFSAEALSVMLDSRGSGILQEHFFNFVYQPIFEVGGLVSGIFVHVVEVTEQVRARQRVEDLAGELKAFNETLEQRVLERTAALIESQEQLRDMAFRLTMAEQEERRRISKILHDDLQQQLYGIQLKLSFARREMESNDTDVALNSLTEAEQWLGQGIEMTRQLTVDLSPPILKSEGLVDMLGWLVSQMQGMHALKVALVAEHPIRIPDEDMRVLLFQIVRELLFNIVKHAGADQAAIELYDVDDRLVIHVTDDGRGFDVNQAAARVAEEGGFGLFSVRERLGLFGGRMQIDSAPGEGTRVTLNVPLSLT